MAYHQSLFGVFAAALTPLNPDHSLALDDFPLFLDFLAQRGCHGILLLGTTGEGPSFSPSERLALMRSALVIRQTHPEFRLLVGTGTPSLDETVELTRAAFDLEFNGVVVLPPYYFRKVPDDGLFTWFFQVIQHAVPVGGALLGYHIPPMTGVPLSLELLARLKDAFPDRFAGIKDSSGDLQHAHKLGEWFGKDLVVLSGTDSLFSKALDSYASGCITAMANLRSPISRRIWDAYQSGQKATDAQRQLDKSKAIMDRYPPNPSLYKALIARLYDFPRWAVRPPLLPMPEERLEQVLSEAMAEVEDFTS